MNKKWLIGITLAVLLSGCGSSTTVIKKEIPGEVSKATQEPGTNKLGLLSTDDVVVLKDKNGTGEEVARIIIPRTWELRDKENKNKCECQAKDPCTPCKVTISRSCGSKINTAERLAEAQPADDKKMALLGATYDITINRDIVPSDTITDGMTVTLKIPKCIYDKTTGKYYNFKDGDVHYIKIWIQPVNSNKPGYWITPNPEIVDGEIKFKVYTPSSHMALFGIVDKPISGSTI